MKYFEEDRERDYRKRSKRANTIPGIGMKTVNKYVIEEVDDESYDFDDEYETNESNYPTTQKD